MTKKIVLGITASIAAYKSCELIGLYKKNGYEVHCILTHDANHFVTPLAIETLSGNKVYGDMFALPENRAPLHTSLAEKADLIVVCPASADIIGKIANGICDNLLVCTIMASRAPVLIAPAMNNNMYGHKTVQKNINILKEIGYKFIGPIKGRLACGHTAVGHIEEVSTIFKESVKLLK